MRVGSLFLPSLYVVIAWIKGRIEVNRALQAIILAKYESTSRSRRSVRKTMEYRGCLNITEIRITAAMPHGALR